MLWRPAAAPPPDGYPVVYLLDANATFGTVTDIIDTQSRRRAVTGMRPAVVVGLGYPTTAPYAPARRRRDLTPRADGEGRPATGGAAYQAP